MKNKKCSPMMKRIIMGTVLGIIFGVLCFAGFASNPDIPAGIAKWQEWSWTNVMMWSTITARMILGLTVALAGVVTAHPRFGFRIYPILRGLKMGVVVSLPMALGSMMGEQSAFWLVIIAGGIIGMIIDVIITKFAGEGRTLVDNNVCN